MSSRRILGTYLCLQTVFFSLFNVSIRIFQTGVAGRKTTMHANASRPATCNGPCLRVFVTVSLHLALGHDTQGDDTMACANADSFYTNAAQTDVSATEELSKTVEPSTATDPSATEETSSPPID